MIASNPESTTLIFSWQSKGRMGESQSDLSSLSLRESDRIT